MNCSVEGCGKPAEPGRRSKLCGMHRRRLRVHGNLNTTLKAANGDGYVASGYAGHQVDGVRKFDHVRIVERVLGRALPLGAVIHHVNEIRSDNRNKNLVLCPDRAYHNLLHARMAALDNCGNPNWRPCRVCRKYDALENLRVYPNGTTTSYWHRLCINNEAREKRRLAK